MLDADLTSDFAGQQLLNVDENDKIKYGIEKEMCETRHHKVTSLS